MTVEEMSFESVNGRTDNRTDDGQKVIPIVHPEHNSGELKISHLTPLEVQLSSITVQFLRVCKDNQIVFKLEFVVLFLTCI